MMMSPAKKVTYNNVCNLISALDEILKVNEQEKIGEIGSLDTKEVIEKLLNAAQTCKVSLESHY